jgi:hypothetical protein
LGTFAIGTGEFGSSGIIQLFASDLDVSIPAATNAITVYALGVVVGSPAITLLAARITRRTLLPCLFGVGAAVMLDPHHPGPVDRLRPGRPSPDGPAQPRQLARRDRRRDHPRRRLEHPFHRLGRLRPHHRRPVWPTAPPAPSGGRPAGRRKNRSSRRRRPTSRHAQ